jgi:hypothetical protein
MAKRGRPSSRKKSAAGRGGKTSVRGAARKGRGTATKPPTKRAAASRKAATAGKKKIRTDRGVPGEGAGRRDEVGRTGVWPMSGPLPPTPEARTVGQQEFGQGSRGAAGYRDSGESELRVIPPGPPSDRRRG